MTNLLSAVSQALNIFGAVVLVIAALAVIPVGLYLGVKRG